jgi:hypothetical protein
MAASGPLRSEDWICRQTLRDSFGKPPGGLVCLGRISTGEVSPDAFANEPDREVGQGRDLVRLQPPPAPATVVGRIFESHAP